MDGMAPDLQLPPAAQDAFDSASAEIDRLFPQRRIERVLFVAPPDADSGLFNYETGKRGRYWNYPPYGLGVIAAHLRADGVEVDILNLNNTVLRACRLSDGADDFDFDRVVTEALRGAITAFNPDVIGVTCMFSQTHPSFVTACAEIRRLAPTTPIAAGGVHVTNSLARPATAGRMLADLPGVDLLFRYEAEIAFRQFVRVVNRRAKPEDLSQVSFHRDGNLTEIAGRRTPEAENLDIVPAHDLMTPTELAQWGKIGSFYCHKPAETRFTTVLSNRGCRAQCTFCSVRNFNGVGVRRRSVASVVDELLMLRDQYGVGHVMWLDDDFLYDREKSMELFNEMIRRDVGMTWDCTNGVIASSCTDEMMAAAAESGCIGLNVGMESGNRRILREIRKPGTVETFLRAAEVLRRHERINARVFLMIGFPGETYHDILDTIEVAREMDLDWYNVTILQPLPNTPIFDGMVAGGLIQEVDFKEIRYNSGGYGKHRKKVEGVTDLLAGDFKDAFAVADMTEVPPRERLDDIWAYMNFHLNFNRLFFDHRPVKLRQQLNYVENITDLIAPENAFAMYFLGYLQQQVSGRIDRALIDRLEERLAQSPYWQQRFNDFRLSTDHLRTGCFNSRTEYVGRKAAAS